MNNQEMEPIGIMSDEEARAIFRLVEDAVVELIHSMNQNFIIVIKQIQVHEDQLAKNSSNSGKPPSSDNRYDKPAPNTHESSPMGSKIRYSSLVLISDTRFGRE